jgi:sortase A
MVSRKPITVAVLLTFGFAAIMGLRPKKSSRDPLPLKSWTGLDAGEGGSRPPEGPPPSVRRPRNRRWSRRLGKALIILGLFLLAYSATILLWRDPVTDLYARWKQHQLAGQLDDVFAAYASTVEMPAPVESNSRPATPQEIADFERVIIAADANKLKTKLKNGEPLGRITIPRIDVGAIFVQGTRWGADLSQGPGHYPQTSLPGVGRTMAIAAHRTTFGAWFRHIDSLEAGDRILIRMPYAAFHYRVFAHRVVKSGDWSIIRDRGFDTLVLSACHPLYSASHRWVVFAELVRVDPVHGTPYLVNRRNAVRPLVSPNEIPAR